MYKYCREVMCSTDDNAFIATVLELPECQANGKTAVEAINNLDIVIEKWIEIAEEMGRAIPEPLHYGAIDLEHVSEDENVPYYDSSSVTWKVVTECGREEGDAIYIASEFVKGSLYYPFHSEPSWKEEYHNHAHDFASVVSFLLKKPDFFSIAGFEEYYSKQEQELLAKLKMKLHIFNEETIAAMEEAEDLLLKFYPGEERRIDFCVCLQTKELVLLTTILCCLCVEKMRLNLWNIGR